MEKFSFYTETLAGLIFNDFIDRDPSILKTYSRHAERVNQTGSSHELIMNAIKGEVLWIDCEHSIPQWVAYKVGQRRITARLNRTITLNMTCVCETSFYKAYKHPSGIMACIMRNPDDSLTYWMFQDSTI